MRYLLTFFCAVFALAALPPRASAQADEGTQQPHLVWDGGALLLGGSLDPSLNHGWAEWSDLEWMRWLVQATPAVEPEPAWPPPPPPLPPAEGSWLRLEADAGGVMIIPTGGVEPPTRTPTNEEERSNRGLQIGIPIAVGLLVATVAVAAVASTNALERSFD